MPMIVLASNILKDTSLLYSLWLADRLISYMRNETESVCNESEELHEIVLEGREFHSLTVDGIKIIFKCVVNVSNLKKQSIVLT